MITDLAGAGYPFDVVTYGQFLGMSLDNADDHDVIILNGHTSPAPVTSIAAKLQRVVESGRKVFVNGHLPYSRYNLDGNEIETAYYCVDLFNLAYEDNPAKGIASVPKNIEKDPKITSRGLGFKHIHTFQFNDEPEKLITISGYNVGFLCPEGGAIDGTSDYLLSVLDYGKVVSYLRYGNPGIVGFAVDRIQGKPIVSFEVHCDSTNDIVAIEALGSLANRFQIPLLNLLVSDKLTPESISKWNSMNDNPFMAFGSHSRTHPMDWSVVPDFHHETVGALASQKSVVPTTINFLGFSGNMNTTLTQINCLYNSGTIFGGAGEEVRYIGLPFGVPWKYFRRNSMLKRLNYKIMLRLSPPMSVQTMPTRRDWFMTLARSKTTPFCLSYTLPCDVWVWQKKGDYLKEIKTNFDVNVKYGLYSYGYIHDYMFNPNNKKFKNRGLHMSKEIESVMEYFESKEVAFVFADHLIRMQRDFIAGWIDYDTNENGSLQVTVYRGSSLANQVKIQHRDKRAAIASGTSVLSQVQTEKFTYVDLEPAIKNTFSVSFETLR